MWNKQDSSLQQVDGEKPAWSNSKRAGSSCRNISNLRFRAEIRPLADLRERAIVENTGKRLLRILHDESYDARRLVQAIVATMIAGPACARRRRRRTINRPYNFPDFNLASCVG